VDYRSQKAPDIARPFQSRGFSRHTFELVKAGKGQVKLVTLGVAAFHLAEPIPGRFSARSSPDVACWDALWNGAIVIVVSTLINTGQNNSGNSRAMVLYMPTQNKVREEHSNYWHLLPSAKLVQSRLPPHLRPWFSAGSLSSGWDGVSTPEWRSWSISGPCSHVRAGDWQADRCSLSSKAGVTPNRSGEDGAEPEGKVQLHWDGFWCLKSLSYNM